MQVSNSYKNILLTVAILFMSASSGFAQESLKDKISAIDSDVEKITITAGGEEFTFEGKDAEKLLEKIKSYKHTKSYSFKINEEAEGDDNTIIIKSLGSDDECQDLLLHGDTHLTWFGEEGDSGMMKIKIISDDNNKEVYIISEGEEEEFKILGKGKNEMSKKIKVEIKDGEKKVTVTTIEDGAERTEVFVDEEAEKYLEEMKSEDGNEILIEMDGDRKHKKLKKIFIEKEVKKEDADK